MKKLNKRLLELYSDRKQILFMSFLGYISYLAQDAVPSDPNIIYSAWGMIAVAVVGAGVSIYQANKNAGIAEDAATDAATERNKQQALLEAQKEEYRSMEFENVYENMENVYEDLTVNQQQAQFQSQQGSQQRSNILQNLKGAAGASGVAGLAQILANQGQLQTQRISTSIGQQEAGNQRLAAQGAKAVQAAELGGEQWVQEAEMSRQSTLLGMQMGAASGANQASALAQANQMNAQMAQNDAWAEGISSVGTAAAGADYGGAGVGGGQTGGMSANPDYDPNIPTSNTWDYNPPNYDQYGNWTGNPLDDPNAANTIDWSDRKLKKNINLVGMSPNGFNIYSFEFKDSKYGEGMFQGVMSDEMPKKVVTKKDGYDMVDYGKLDVEFKQI